jgi:hypothetical protein
MNINKNGSSCTSKANMRQKIDLKIEDLEPRVFSFRQLSQISDENVKFLNQNVDLTGLEDRKLFLCIPVMIHEHAFGERVDPHIRAFVLDPLTKSKVALQDIYYEQWVNGTECKLCVHKVEPNDSKQGSLDSSRLPQNPFYKNKKLKAGDSDKLNANIMELKCKYLIDSTKGWSTELYVGCLQLEVFVENLEGVGITNSLSDFQPSYVVYKIEGDRQFEMNIDPRIRGGKLVYFVRDYINKVQNLFNSREDLDTYVYFDNSQPGGLQNPYIMDAETLKNKILNIDMSEGFLIKKAS